MYKTEYVMTQEEKQLLLKDLCARVPYGVKLDNGLKLRSVDALTQIVSCSGSDRKVDYVKPYLRPMSSMTEDERQSIEKLSGCYVKTIVLERDRKGRAKREMSYLDNQIDEMDLFGDSDYEYRHINQQNIIESMDYLNAHHFDYRGLIEKGLALEAPEGMYTIK